jgi:hypothetical protein
MGRLTLNVLLSFAQFEREVAGERIRDKFAASRRKGMWMGGTIPLGYDVQDRKLVVNDAEAETFRLIFRRYLLLVLGWVFGAFAASSAFSRPAKSSDELGCAKTKSDLVVMPRGAEADNRWAYVGR